MAIRPGSWPATQQPHIIANSFTCRSLYRHLVAVIHETRKRACVFLFIYFVRSQPITCLQAPQLDNDNNTLPSEKLNSQHRFIPSLLLPLLCQFLFIFCSKLTIKRRSKRCKTILASLPKSLQSPSTLGDIRCPVVWSATILFATMASWLAPAPALSVKTHHITSS